MKVLEFQFGQSFKMAAVQTSLILSICFNLDSIYHETLISQKPKYLTTD